jgi:thiamine biosynthesis lipoprotein
MLVTVLCLASCRSSPADASKAGESLSRQTASHEALGTAFRVTLYAPDARTASTAVASAFARLDVLDRILNANRADSEIAALNRTPDSTRFKLSDDLFAVLQHAQRLASGTRGAFDVTLGPYIDVWRRAAAEGRAPTQAELENAKLHVGWDKLRLNAIERTATLTVPGMRLDLSGIAVGHAADAAYRVLRAGGCERAIIEAGSVIIAGAAPPGREGWPTVIQGGPGPERDRTIPLSNTAVAFSPNTPLSARPAAPPPPVPRLIDPSSGRAADGRVPAAVLAGSGATAQSVAWAAAVLGPAGAGALTAAEGTARVRFGTAAPVSPGGRRK